MLGVIHPVRCGKNFWTVGFSHLFGCALAGGATGLVLGWVGGAILRPRGEPLTAFVLALLAFLSLLFAAHHAGILRVPMPCLARQVNKGWLGMRNQAVGAFFFGLGLGNGLQTVITFGGFYVVVLACVFSGDPVVGAAMLGVFGACSALPVLFIGSAFKAVEEFPRQLQAVSLLGGKVSGLRAWILAAAAVGFCVQLFFV